MARYIDADKFAERIKLSPAFKKSHFEFGSKILQAVVLDLLGNMPVADVEEVKHGEWVDTDPLEWDCSVCGYRVKRWNSTPYCPHCGAKMDGRSED